MNRHCLVKLFLLPFEYLRVIAVSRVLKYNESSYLKLLLLICFQKPLLFHDALSLKDIDFENLMNMAAVKQRHKLLVLLLLLKFILWSYDASKKKKNERKQSVKRKKVFWVRELSILLILHFIFSFAIINKIRTSYILK